MIDEADVGFRVTCEAFAFAAKPCHHAAMAFTGSLEDRLAIRELHDTYADAGFRVDREAWLDCWTEDAIWVTPYGEVCGKPALEAQWDLAMGPVEAIGFFAKVGSIEVDGDRAVTRAYIREIFKGKDGKLMKLVGRYDDRLVRQGGAWKFASRVYDVLIREVEE